METKCLVCGEAGSLEELTIPCSQCDVKKHPDCHEYYPSCPTYGCNELPVMKHTKQYNSMVPLAIITGLFVLGVGVLSLPYFLFKDLDTKGTSRTYKSNLYTPESKR